MQFVKIGRLAKGHGEPYFSFVVILHNFSLKILCNLPYCQFLKIVVYFNHRKRGKQNERERITRFNHSDGTDY